MKVVGGALVLTLAFSAALAALLGSPMYMGPRAFDQPLKDTSPKVNTSSDTDSIDDLPIITTKQGKLRGSFMLSRLGRVIYAFRGIPYAQPPVGNLRFKPPVPPSPWKGIRNATEDGYACPQELDYVIPTSEDCLLVNVYTTRLPSRRRNPKRPVLLWIHAGGWYGGTAASAMHGPQYLADEDVVLVTLNYRLGALGFLSTGDDVIPGNFGLKDQVQAMHWVQNNILAFGGDPDRVTLAGYSAGAASVWFHLASHMSRGLFHQAIAMSSSINAQYDISARSSFKMAQKQATVLDCPSGTSEEIKECLMNKPAQDISSSIFKLTDWGIDPILIFYPVVEPEYEDGSDRFLHDNIANLILSGDFAHVPWITGHTKDEFSWKGSTVLNNSTLRSEMNNDFHKIAPLAFMYTEQENSDHISDELQKFYLQGQPLSESNMNSLGELYSDSIINFGVDRAARVISGLNTAPVYYYKFDCAGRYSFVYQPGTSVPYGIMHQDDSMYLFYMSALFPFFQEDDPETKIVERLTKMWGNFVKTGNPTPTESDLINVIWDPITPDDLNYLNIGNNLIMKQGLYRKRMSTWNRLFPLPQENTEDWDETEVIVENK